MAKKSAKAAAPAAEEQPVANEVTTHVEVPKIMNLDEVPGSVDNLPEDGAGGEKAVLSARENAMKSILASRAKVFEHEQEYGKRMLSGGEGEEVPAEEEKPAEPNAPEAPPAEKPAEAPPAQDPGAEPQPAAARTKLVVEGQQMEVSQEDLVRLAQMGMSATQRYQEAARIKEEAQALVNSIKQPQGANPNSQPQSAGNAQPSPQDLIDSETARGLVKRINYGTEEEQISAIRELGSVVAAKVGAQNALPADQLVNAAVHNSLAMFNYQQNMTQLATEYPDIFKDKNLSVAAGAMANNLLQQYNGQKPYFEVMREALNTMRGYLPGKEAASEKEEGQKTQTTVQAKTPTVVSMNDRLERKRAAPQPPTAASKIASDVTRAAPTPSDIVARMRKQRHQSAF